MSIPSRSPMSKPRYKITNWKQYNQSLINRGSLTKKEKDIKIKCVIKA